MSSELTQLTQKRHQFFATDWQVPKGEEAIARALLEYSGDAHGLKYKDIYPHVDAIESEANLLYVLFKSNKKKSKHSKVAEQQAYAMAYLLYYVCHILKNYYEHYSQLQQRAFDERLSELEAFFKEENIDKKAGHAHVISQMVADAKANTIDILINSAKHTSVLRANVDKLNMWRIYWIFVHFSANQSVLVANQYKIFEFMSKLTGHHIDGDRLLNTLNIPNQIFNVLSVAIYALRLLIDIVMILKHTIGASDSEKEADRKARFLKEWHKRKWDMLNNIVWGTINLLTNYNWLFGISGALAMQLIAGVLIFDVILVSIKYSLAHEDYQKNSARLKRMKTSHETAIDSKQQQLKKLDEVENAEEIARLKREINGLNNQLQVVKQEIKALDDSWEVTKGVFRLYMGAALLLFTSFTASLFMPGAGLVLMCYMLGTVAVAMYLSGDQYAASIKANQNLNYAITTPGEEISETDVAAYKAEAEASRASFYSSIAEKALVPNLLLLTFAVSWQVGLLLVVAYIGYKLYQHYGASNDTPSPEHEVTPYALECAPA